MKKTYDRPTLSHELALEMLRAAVGKAEELGVKEVVSIVDVSGALIAFCSMDGAPAISTQLSQDKAFTAALGLPSHLYWDLLSDKPDVLLGLASTRTAPFMGGYPVIIDGVVVGAIAAGGGSAEEDSAIARAGLVPTGEDIGRLEQVWKERVSRRVTQTGTAS